MKLHFMELLYLWNYYIYGITIFMDLPFYGFTFLWIYLFMDLPFYGFTFYGITFYVRQFYELLGHLI